MTQKCVALLGRRDEPTDAVEEYCRYLAAALAAHNFELSIERVAWKEKGWTAALAELRERARDRRGAWVFLQYTALAWSERGFPSRFIRVLNVLRNAGARVAVVYHDVEPYSGTRIVDRLRRRSQLRVMRASAGHLRIFTVPPEKLSWRPTHKFPVAFIPVGANFPDPILSDALIDRRGSEPLTVAVFGITGGAAGSREVAEIARAMRDASSAAGNLRLVAFGRNAEVFAEALREALHGAAVELRVFGVLSAEDVASTLCQADVLLFVRGAISTRRGSAIAGIACGLPVVAFAGTETVAPITKAGLALYTPEKTGDLSRVLTAVLQDASFRAQLAARSRAAQKEYFSWSAIARRYAEELDRVTRHSS